MDRKERILSYISSNTYVPLRFNELAIVLDVPESDRNELSGILDSLVKEGKIYKTKKGRYCVISEKGLTAAGVLMCNAAGGFGFVRIDGEEGKDIFIAREKLGGAYDRDRVLVRIENNDNGRGHREGHIEQIIERGNTNIVGVLVGMKNGYYRVSPDRREFFSQIRIREEDLGGASAGDRVMVSIEEYNSKGKPVGIITAVLGSGDSVESCLNGLIAENKIPERFSKKVLEAADSLPESVTDEEIKAREDLRDKRIFTIDGDDSRDFDDAVSLEALPSGRMMLGVHIADVTHYVKDGSVIDKEALKRATSVYFPNKVIPMLPKRLSNGICSLNPDVDRLTLSIFMEIDKDGNIHNHRLSKSVIHSCARMTYNKVNKILGGDTKLREQYSFIVPVLEEMDRLSDALAKKRKERGAIDFDFPEAKIKCDNAGEPVEVEIEERGKSQRLIESFMLAANETVAEMAYWAELPFVYRVHDAPSNEKLTAFNEFIKNFGYSLKGKIDSESIHPMDLQGIAEKVKGSPEEMMISKVMLQSLMKAGYRDTNDGHFGLAARFYCHFTSPIRRYPDLMIHRVLKEFISGNLSDSRQHYFEPRVREAAIISSDREIAAEKAERDADDMMKAAYMRRFIGESFDAVVSSVTSFGMFAALGNSCEGLIRCENMSGDYFEYDENRHMLIGRHTGRTYRVGDMIRITVAASNLLMRRIDFVLEGDARRDILAKIEKRSRTAMGRSDEKKEKHGKHRRMKRKYNKPKKKRKR
ncbi:MAG: ribonuclease R [Clostridiales bacterium]|nr:ribonuclease R [Clostridiales bacterium]